MVLNLITHALRSAEELKQRVLCSNDILNDYGALTARLQLLKIYEQVLLLDLEYAVNKKVEQDLWNIGFKNYIDVLQKLVKEKKNPKRSEYQGLLNVCLESASGFYLILLEEICATFSFNLPFPSYRKHSYLQSNAKVSHIEHLIKQPKKSSCCYICQHCLVHLGDIARYKFRCKQAEIFYRNAIVLSPSSGQPYNQLALLETSRGDKLATVFYYVRSIAVRNPFPAATSNLALTLNKANVDGEWNTENKTVLSINEFVTLFLKVHAVLHLTNNVHLCTSYVRLLATSLTAHVATESFTPLNLVQMMIINIFAYHHVNNENDTSQEAIADRNFIKTLLIELIAGSLNAFLLPIYTYKQEDSILQYFALPAVKITVDWIRINSHVLEEPGFTTRPQIWPAFCRLLNEFGPALQSFTHEKYKNVTLPEDQDIQGFIPLGAAIPDFRYADNEVDLDNLNKLRAHRIRNFSLWLADQTKVSSLKVNKDSDVVKFVPAITGGLNSNEMIIQQLEELLKNDCKVSQSDFNLKNDVPACRILSHNATKKSVVPSLSSDPTIITSVTSVSFPPAENIQSKRTGILKTQSFLDKKDKTSNNDTRKQNRQNVALQTILKRNQEQEHKQVTFKTPSPSLSTCSDNQESMSPSLAHSQLWPSGGSITTSNTSHQSTVQPSSHPMFVSSFPTYPDSSFRSLHSSNTLMPPPSNVNFPNKSTSQFYPQSMSQDVQPAFNAQQLYQKPFVPLPTERIDPFVNATNVNNDIRNQNLVDNNLLPQLSDNRHLQRNQFAPSQPNLNFMPPWKQEQPNSWWMDEKRDLINPTGMGSPSVIDDQSNSLFHYRNPVLQSHVSQPSNLSFGGNTQSQFQPQAPPPPLAPHQLRQMPQQTQQQAHLRVQNSSNIPIGLWSNSYKQPPAQNNMNSLFNTSMQNKQPLFDTASSYNQQPTTPSNEDKQSYPPHSPLPNNTYSLFSSMWGNSSTGDNQLNQTSNNPLAVLTNQSIWSEGVSPLQRLLEQQKQMRERPTYHSSHQTTNE